MSAEEILRFFTTRGAANYSTSGIGIVQTTPYTVIFLDTDKARAEVVKKYDRKPLRPLESRPFIVHLQCIRLEEAQIATTCAISVSEIFLKGKHLM